MVNIAINGFGRIGRGVFKIALERRLNVVAINDIHGAENAAYLLKYDSIYGHYKGKIHVLKDMLIVDGHKIRVFSEREPENLPWKALGIDVIVESTGAFTKGRDAEKHIKAGAKRVVITAPADKPDVTIVPGVNEKMLKNEHKIISVGSCTTNCAAVVAKVILESFGIKWSMLTTVHAYTNDQVMQDSAHKNIRRGRAGAVNIIPTTTGAAEAVLQVLPQLKGKMTGLSIRVPVQCGSLIDFTAEVLNKATIEQVNDTMKRASLGKMKNILSVTEDPIVSSDVIGDSHSAIVDLLSTQVDGNLIKVLAWYDNEFGSSNRFVDVVEMLK